MCLKKIAQIVYLFLSHRYLFDYWSVKETKQNCNSTVICFFRIFSTCKMEFRGELTLFLQLYLCILLTWSLWLRCNICTYRLSFNFLCNIWINASHHWLCSGILEKKLKGYLFVLLLPPGLFIIIVIIIISSIIIMCI